MAGPKSGTWPALLAALLPWCLAATPNSCVHVPRREVLQGSSVAVPCSGADGLDGHHIRWYKDGQAVLLAAAPRSGRAVNGSSLHLTHLSLADSGCYQCSWKEGRWSSYAIRVIGPMSPPVLSDLQGNVLGPKLGSLVQGEPLELLCSPPQGFPAARLRWGATPSAKLISSGPGLLLRIDALERRHQGAKLRCTASQPVAGGASTSVTLDIFMAPEQVLLIRRGPLVAGVSAELECVAWGSRPEASLQWMLAGRPLTSAFTHWDGRNVSTATVTIRPTPADHGRRLVCAAANPKTPSVPPVQAERRLDVHYPPEVHLETCHAASAWACLHCRVDANPAPLRLSWTRDGELLRGIAPLSSVLRWRQKPGRLEHYVCMAENALGAGSSRPVGLVLLEKQGKTTLPVGLAASLLFLLALLLFLVAVLCTVAWWKRRRVLPHTSDQGPGRLHADTPWTEGNATPADFQKPV